jgi:hypothetical protein
MQAPPVQNLNVADQLLQQMPRHWPNQLDLLNFCQDMGPLTATVLVILGIIFLLFGYYLYKLLVVLNVAALAALFGAVAGDKLGSALGGAVVGGLSAGALTWFLMTYAVSVMGGLFGAILGASLWRSFGLEPKFTWAGATIGLVFFGLLSFILFRGCVILYTSLQGSVMLIFGVLGLVYKYQDAAARLTAHLSPKPAILLLAIFIPMILGLMFQQSNFPPPAPAKK